MSKEKEAKSSIINYVENFVDKREKELGTKNGTRTSVTRKIDRDSIVIKSDEDYYLREKFVSIFFVLRYSQNFSQIILIIRIL